MSSSSQRSSTPSMIFASAAAYTQQLQSHMKGKGLKVARSNYGPLVSKVLFYVFLLNSSCLFSPFLSTYILYFQVFSRV